MQVVALDLRNAGDEMRGMVAYALGAPARGIDGRGGEEVGQCASAIWSNVPPFLEGASNAATAASDGGHLSGERCFRWTGSRHRILPEIGAPGGMRRVAYSPSLDRQ